MAFLQSLLNALPQAEGLLPKWQLFVATMAVFNSAQGFVSPKVVRGLYAGTSVTGLQARTFAAWTLTGAVVRAYAAYNIHNKCVYDIAMFTYLFAFGHFASELFIFRTAKINSPVLSPVVVSTASVIWMWQQYGFYVQA